MSDVVVPAHEDPDETLVARVRSGDPAAFDGLVRRHLRRAFGLAYRITGQREDAEDLVQDAFLSALEHLDSYDDTRPFRPWLDRIVVNRAINSRQRTRRHPVEPLPEQVAVRGASPSAAVEQRELKERLAAALDELPERQRSIVQLSGYEGMSSREIGELLELPAGTVRWELHQARRALRERLAACREGGR